MIRVHVKIVQCSYIVKLPSNLSLCFTTLFKRGCFCGKVKRVGVLTKKIKNNECMNKKHIVV